MFKYFLLLIVFSISSWAGPAPVQDRSLSQKRLPTTIVDTSNIHRVRKGDTLQTIAFFYKMDMRTIQRLNKLGKNKNIYVGQKLALTPNVHSFVRESSGISEKAIGYNSPSPQYAPAYEPAPIAANNVPVQWRWPHQGRVLRGFSNKKGKVNNGIDIAGNLGTPILAAASGKVVYAGNGLLGYGNLIIIDHNSEFLSAYAHNTELFVRENDQVKSGMKIASMGHTGVKKVMLHFEIRRKGLPVNPLSHLPRR